MQATDPERLGVHTTRSLDWWFRALDHRWIEVGASHWLGLVTGIHVDGHDLWIQLAHADDPVQGLVIHISQAATLDGVRATVPAWRPQDAHPRVVSVTHSL